MTPPALGATVCAWCPQFGRVPAVIVPGDPTQPVSHGLCPACLAAIEAQP